MFPREALYRSIALPALIAVAALLYLPGLGGDFIFDDFINIVSNNNAHMTAFTWDELRKVLGSGIATSLSRPLSMLTFGLNSYFSGLSPYAFKLTNLLVHLLNTAGIYVLARELTRLLHPQRVVERRDDVIALVVAACWALHPANVSTVLYVVQRMTLLSATVSIFTLVGYLRFRLLPQCSLRQAALAFVALGAAIVAGVLFKENSILIVAYILCIEFFLLDFKAANAGHKRFLQAFLALMLAVPGVVGVLYIATHPEFIMTAYEAREFTLLQRLLTEARVLWQYLGWLLMPDIRDFVFYYDDYAWSQSLLQPASTALACAGLLVLAALVVAGRKRLPAVCFGIAFFFAGHALESTFIGLELVFEHRNYLPGFGIMFALVHGLFRLPSWILRRELAAGVLAFYGLFLAHGTWMEARKWSSSFEHLTAMISQNPDSHRLNYGMGYFLLDLASVAPNQSELFQLASDFFRKAAALDKSAIRGHAGAIQADTQNGKAPDPQLLEELYRRVQNTPRLDDYLTEISNLVECYYTGFCKFDGQVLIGLYNAMASNEQSQAIVVQGMLDQVGTAIAYSFKRPEDGLAVLQLARSQRPDFTIIDLKVIHLQIELGHLEEARQLLAAARAYRDAARYSENLDELEAMLAARRPAAP